MTLYLTTLLMGCGGEDHIEMMSGAKYMCVLTDGTLECQSNGEGPDSDEASPPVKHWESVTHGYAHLCGFASDHTPYCWGGNESGQTDIPSSLPIGSFFLGHVNTCVIEIDGSLACWGNEWTGLNETPPGTYVQAAATERVACARSQDGAWSCWGDGWGVDETENGDVYDWTLPEETLVELEGEAGNMCGLDEDGAIHCWGRSNRGINESSPEGTGYRDLSVARDHACAIDSANDVQCWGQIEFWQQRIEGPWITYDAGTWVDCGVRDDGEIDCWGCHRSDPFSCDWDE